MMPAEWAPHAGCWMIWPARTDNWRAAAAPAQAAFTVVASQISRFEPVTMLANAAQFARARNMLPASVNVVEAGSDDAWCRDVGPSFLIGPEGLGGVDWMFNSWGGLEKGLYAPWDLDDKLAANILERAGARAFRAPVVLEGGAIHVDGQGTVMVTEACLLDTHRNPGITRERMERMLSDYLGTTCVIWLGDGTPQDETGGHIDNLACFIRPGVVLLSWCDDPRDPHYAVSRDARDRLACARDARGRAIEVVPMPMPAPMFMTPEEEAGIDHVMANGMSREAGQRLAASYVNFYIANGAIVAPSFGVATDEPAFEVLKQVFPDREVIMIPAREILLGGGNIHCITQQQPESPNRGTAR